MQCRSGELLAPGPRRLAASEPPSPCRRLPWQVRAQMYLGCTLDGPQMPVPSTAHAATRGGCLSEIASLGGRRPSLLLNMPSPNGLSQGAAQACGSDYQAVGDHEAPADSGPLGPHQAACRVLCPGDPTTERYIWRRPAACTPYGPSQVRSRRSALV